MERIKYIVLYTPLVLISALGFLYYGVSLFVTYPGMKELCDNGEVSAKSLGVLLEVYRLVNTGIAPLCFLWLIWHMSKKGKDLVFRAHVFSMMVCFIAPKIIDHLMMVIKSATSNSHIPSIYDYSIVQIACFVLWLIILPINVREARKKEDSYGRYN